MSFELHRAIVEVWNAANLDYNVKLYWSSLADQTQYEALHETEATPRQPWPYVVYFQQNRFTTTRMTGHGLLQTFETQDIPWTFKVYAKSAGGESGKRIASRIAAAIMSKFGGHPSGEPSRPMLQNGSWLTTLLLSEYSTREGDDEYSWTINYLCRLDMPVAITAPDEE